MTVSRRDVLVMMGVAVSSLSLPAAAGVAATTESPPMAADAAAEAATAAGDRALIQVVSVHNFLYPDRHGRLYPRLPVYLNGDPGKIAPFIDCLEKKMTAAEIRDALGLQYRGDVWFGTLLVYFHIRDGLVDLPNLDIEPPAELADQLARLENDWLTRNDPPPPDPWPPKVRPAPQPPKPIAFLEEEIEGLESLRAEYAGLGPGLDRLIQRRRDQIASRTGSA